MNQIQRPFPASQRNGISSGATVLISAVFTLLLAGCGKPAGGFTPPPPEVSVVTVTNEALPVTTTLPGRLDAVRTAEVRARVAGILLKKVYQEGSDVKAGDVLFQIDPAPFQAVYDGAQATLAKADANLTQAQQQLDRDAVLVKIRAVSQQTYDDDVSAVAQGKADLLVAKAALETAALNLGYATVTSPITGRSGVALVTEGALVGQSEATELTLVQQLDPIYFDFTESSVDLLRLEKQLAAGELKSPGDGAATISLLLEDGSVYPHEGKLLFANTTVDPTTGMITLRAEFPNPDHWLLPGMFARGKLEQAVNSEAIAISQRAVQHGTDGSATVFVVTPDNKVEVRPVKADTATGDRWIVTDGLKNGERVIVAGLQKIQPGMTVAPVPFAAATNAPAAGQTEKP